MIPDFVFNIMIECLIYKINKQLKGTRFVSVLLCKCVGNLNVEKSKKEKK